MSDFVVGIQNLLQDSDEIQALVTDETIGKDAGWVNGWIFSHTLKRRMENTQQVALVVAHAGGGAPEPLASARFPSVAIDFWADPTRADDHSLLKEDAEDKIFKVYSAVFRVLHRTTTEPLYLDGERVDSIEAVGDLDPIRAVGDGNGLKFSRARFNITLF